MSHLPIWFLGQAPDEECNKAFERLKTIAPKGATMGINADNVDTTNRDTTIRFAEQDDEFGLNMYGYAMHANTECKWGFELDSHEAVQLAEYKPEQHYNWHMDTFHLNGTGSDRKVTVVCLMNDPSEFEGGDLVMRFGQQEYVVPLKKGSVVAFPSFIEHKVTPVTSGIRYTAAMWVKGPAFR